MPFFGSSKHSSSSSRKLTSESSRESHLSPPPVYSDDDVFGTDYKSSSVYFDPPLPVRERKELNSGAKRLLRNRAGKENGLKKLIRRHSHKLARELRDPSPENQPPPPYSPGGKLRNGRLTHSLDAPYHGADMVRHQPPPTGPKGVHFAEQEAKMDYYNQSDKIRKQSKLKKSKSVHQQKMPLHSVLKPPSSGSSGGGAARSDEDRLSQSSEEYFSHRQHAANAAATQNAHHILQLERQRQFYADYHGKTTSLV